MPCPYQAKATVEGRQDGRRELPAAGRCPRQDTQGKPAPQGVREEAESQGRRRCAEADAATGPKQSYLAPKWKTTAAEMRAQLVVEPLARRPT